MAKLELKAEVGGLERVTAFIDEQLEAADCPVKTQMQIELAVEEIFVNIANYAYPPGEGVVSISAEIAGGTAVITFEDKGVPYDPLEKTDPDINLSAEQREIGGLGIFMVKKSMDDVRYEYRDGMNILTLVMEFMPK